MHPITMTENLHNAPGVKWVVEDDGLQVWDPQGRVHRITYPQAALWDLMTRGYRYDALVMMMIHITQLDKTQTVRLMNDTVDQWLAAGLLTRSP